MADKNSSPSAVGTFFLFLPFIGFLIVFSALIWANYRYADSNPGGVKFFPLYQGTRSFIFNGQSPYSDDTAGEIQSAFRDEGIQVDGNDHRFFSPFYASLIIAPFSLFRNYAMARAVWMTVLEITVLVIGILSIRLAEWRVSLWLIPIYLVYLLFWQHGLQALIEGNPAVLVTVFIIGALIAIRQEQDVLAGFLIALSTIKPSLVVLLVLYLLVWAASHRRWSLIGWISGWSFLLVLLGVIFMDDWVMQNIWAVVGYGDYQPTLSVGAELEKSLPGVGRQLNWGLTIFLALLLIFEWWRSVGKEYNQFLWTACLTVVISQWFGIGIDPTNFILLSFPMVLIFSVIKERWQFAGNFLVLGILTLLFVGLWWLYLDSGALGGTTAYPPVMFVPIPLFELLGLYWARWWLIRPTRWVSSAVPPVIR